MAFTFETLPDEILMIILKYSGDVYTILRTFLGLNQRLNRILVDKRLHLLTDFLHINIRDDYYDSDVFKQISEQLLHVNGLIDEEKLIQLFQPLLSYHIQQKYIQMGHDLQINLEKFNSIRQQFTHDEILNADRELTEKFDGLDYSISVIGYIQQIEALVLTKGARLTCDNYELCRFNLTKCVNSLLLSRVNDSSLKIPISVDSLLQIFKTLIISNTSLLKNRDYTGNGGCTLLFFLVYSVYRLTYFYGSTSSTPVNMKVYRATVDLLLFAIQCQKHMVENENSTEEILLDILEMISETNTNMFIRTTQCEILKIVVDEYILIATNPWDDHLNCEFQRKVRRLFECHRVDLLIYIYRHITFVRNFFHESNYIRESMNIITRNQSSRQFFNKLIDEKSVGFLFPEKDLVFILLQKKERKLLEKVLKLSPYLIHQIDEDGNDPLLYISLNVNGCRHRIVEFLIKMGSDLLRRNFKEENFFETLQLQRNKKLLQKLIEQEIINVDDIQRKIQV